MSVSFFFFFKQKTAYEIGVRLVGSEMCIRDSTQTLTLAIYTYVSRGNDGIAAALATILSLTTVVSLLLFMKLSKSKDVTL